MGTHGWRREGWRLAFGTVVALALAIPVHAAPPAKGKGKAPAAPAEKLPPGCVRLADGIGAVPSPDGKSVAYVQDGASVFLSSKHKAGTGTLVLRNVKSDTTSALAERASPLGWVGPTLLLESGVALDTQKGGRSTRLPSAPAGAPVAAVSWTPDGKRIAWVPQVVGKARTAVQVLGVDGKPRALAGTDGLRTDQSVFLAWSPSGTHVCVNALSQPDAGRRPERRVALVDASTGTASVLATMPDWVGIPGLSAGTPYYRDPRIEDPKTVDLDWDRPAEPRYGPQVFSGDGRIVAWLAGTGWLEADAFVAATETGEVHRVTNDGDAKWSPAVDPAGRRLAYMTAEGLSKRGLEGYVHPRLRVVDLVTGESSDFEIAFQGLPARLWWTADGTALLYDVRTLPMLMTSHAGSAGPGTFAQTVARAKAAPADAKLISLPYDPRNRIVAWLASYDEDRVHTAVHRAEDAWDPYYLPALRETLAAWKSRESSVPICLAHMLDLKQAKEAIPDLRAALSTSLEENRAAYLVALLHLGDAGALEDLERLRTGTKDEFVRFRAAHAMVEAGDERGWTSIAAAARSDVRDVRKAVCRALAKIRQARSVEILIPLVSDHRSDARDEKLRALGVAVKDRPVAPIAQLALRALTGKALGDDPAKWTKWWKEEAKGQLPADVPPPDDPDGELGG